MADTGSPSSAGPLMAMYFTARRFAADSKLHAYLASKCPDLIATTKSDYTLREVIFVLKSLLTFNA
jgi:hypothetical protein